MKEKNKRQQQAKVLRVFRKLHRQTGALLFVFFFLIALSGLLLTWKKNSFGYLVPPTQKGSSLQSKDWISIDSLQGMAILHFQKAFPDKKEVNIERIDIRPEKGTAKVLFDKSYWALQLDLSSGALLLIEQRRGDFIEHLHDGSVLDEIAGTESGIFKLIYSSITSLALLLFTITGFWLWYGPKRMKKGRE